MITCFEDENNYEGDDRRIMRIEKKDFTRGRVAKKREFTE